MSVARVYAKAFYENISQQSGAAAGATAARGGTDPSSFGEELQNFLEILNSNNKLSTALSGPILINTEKTKIIQELCKKAALSVFTERFLVLLCRKGRLSSLAVILREFRQLVVGAAGGVIGSVTSASPLGVSDLNEISQIYSKKLGKKVVLYAEEDPNLLAGFKVHVSGVTYDGSLRSQLNRIKDRFLIKSEKSEK